MDHISSKPSRRDLGDGLSGRLDNPLQDALRLVRRHAWSARSLPHYCDGSALICRGLLNVRCTLQHARIADSRRGLFSECFSPFCLLMVRSECFRLEQQFSGKGLYPLEQCTFEIRRGTKPLKTAPRLPRESSDCRESEDCIIATRGAKPRDPWRFEVNTPDCRLRTNFDNRQTDRRPDLIGRTAGLRTRRFGSLSGEPT